MSIVANHLHCRLSPDLPRSLYIEDETKDGIQCGSAVSFTDPGCQFVFRRLTGFIGTAHRLIDSMLWDTLLLRRERK